MFNTHHVPSTLFEKRNGFLQGLYYQKYTRPHQYFTESIIFVTIIRGDIGSGSYNFQRFCKTQSQPPDPMSPGTTIRFFFCQNFISSSKLVRPKSLYVESCIIKIKEHFVLSGCRVCREPKWNFVCYFNLLMFVYV